MPIDGKQRQNNTVEYMLRRLWARIPTLLGFAAFFLIAGQALAHERWILSPDQIAEWNAHPRPKLYSELSPLNVTMISLFLLFILGWVRLGFTGARELFPDLQARLASYGDHVPRILRVCLAWMLLSSAFGMEPRFGVAAFTSPTLFAPDLELRLLGPEWHWLAWAEVVLGLTILFGIYVRFFAVLLILMTLLGAWLFGEAILAYAGALIGAATYLLMQGAGRHFLPLPTPSFLLGLQSWLETQPRQRAQAIMRVLTGTTMLYLGMYFKVFQPNLVLGIISTYHVPMMSAAPETFTLLMALVEVSAGILIIAGILLRPLSLFFLFAFTGFALLLPETLTEHILFYGVILSFLINGAGHWQVPQARDKAAEIVIVGGGFSGIHAAMKIEKLIGHYSHVHVTLIHDDTNMLFFPLLPELIGGTMQPGNVVNPIRRVVPQTRVVTGQLDYVDEQAKRVVVRRKNGKEINLPYAELIFALFPVPNLTGIPGMMAHASPIDSVGDALHIRKCVLDRIEEAEFTEVAAERDRLLTFAVVGSGQRACATAVELCQMLRTAEVSYPVLREHGWQVYLYEDTKMPFTDLEAQIQPQRDRGLEKAGVKLCRDDEVVGLTHRDLAVASGERRPAGLVVNASFRLPTVAMSDQCLRWPFEIEDDLSLKAHQNIWVTAMKKQDQERRFITTADLVALGNAVGYNAWASSQGYATRPIQPRKRLLEPYNMGRRSLCRLGGFTFGGAPAWIVSRLTNLLAMPGLERNLRILMDWVLDIPFRNDIAVLAPDPTERLQRAHFEPGDEVIRQGDEGETAYVIESGRLEVLKDGNKLGELGEGDCFGEIALLSNVRRNATVRCLTACELAVLARDDFGALTTGFGSLAEAIRKQAEERVQMLRDNG
jgi:NADH dehydrogenase FAD-containing subunit/uncharacterized membrane protein YphA (DoxX/SURF4 family)